MKITIESTTRMVEVNGSMARVWQGKTEGGIDVVCLVASVSSPREQDQSEMADLEEHVEPKPIAIAAYPARFLQ